MIIDSHCHLHYAPLYENLDNVIANAKQNDVKILQNISTKLEDMPYIIEIFQKYDNIFASVGVHPNEVTSEEAIVTLEELEEYVKNYDKINAIGETGLDYFRENFDKTSQIQSFRNHIAVARKYQIPCVVHTRNAWDDTLKILEEELRKGFFPFLIHCFVGNLEQAKKVISMGGYISISGIVTFKSGKEVQEVVKEVNMKYLLVETDSPFLTPSPEKRNNPNEPKNTLHVVNKIAEIKNIAATEIIDITTQNYFSLFTKIMKNNV